MALVVIGILVQNKTYQLTPPESGRQTNLLYFTCSYGILSRFSYLSLYYLFYVTMIIWFYFYFGIARDVVTVLLILVNICHFRHTLTHVHVHIHAHTHKHVHIHAHTHKHVHIHAHAHKHTCMMSAQQEWRELRTGA